MFQIKNTPGLWRYLVYVWTLVFYAAVIADFITSNAYKDLLGPLAAIYIAVLAIYAGTKEFERWHSLYQGRHPGELFVLGWSVLIVFLLLAEWFFFKTYRLPDAVVYTYITVLSVLALTKKSRSLYQQKYEKSAEEESL